MNGLDRAFSGLMLDCGIMTCSSPPTTATGSYTATPRQLPRACVTSTSPATLAIFMSATPTTCFTAVLSVAGYSLRYTVG